MLAKRKKSHKIPIKVYKFSSKQRFFAFFVVFGTLLFLYIKFIAVPLVITNTQSQIKTYATRSINYAVADTMNQDVSYGDLINIIRDENNNVSYIEANSVRINLLSKSMSKVVMNNFLEFAKRPIKIALGSFSGISMFVGAGPKIAFEINPFGEVYCNFISNFESAGINQTYHKLYLTISLKVYVVFPFRQLKINSNAEVLLCETLIIGKIPEVYFQTDTLQKMLNLVPDKFSTWQI